MKLLLLGASLACSIVFAAAPALAQDFNLDQTSGVSGAIVAVIIVGAVVAIGCAFLCGYSA
jgi:hypothetical protein